MKTTAWVGATLFFSALATAPDGLAQEPTGEQCPPRNGQSIVITSGDIDCVTAADYAARFDVDGEKYQTIAPFTATTSRKKATNSHGIQKPRGRVGCGREASFIGPVPERRIGTRRFGRWPRLQA